MISPDDGQRVILAALDIQRRLASLDTVASIGIACGHVFTYTDCFLFVVHFFGMFVTYITVWCFVVKRDRPVGANTQQLVTR